MDVSIALRKRLKGISTQSMEGHSYYADAMVAFTFFSGFKFARLEA